MTRKLNFMIVIAIAIGAAPILDAQVAVREFRFHTIAGAHPVEETERATVLRKSSSELRTVRNELDKLKVYPAAGEFGRDVFVPYFVDLDPASPGELDFRCADYTFDDHTGHDPYIRSFREQEIGVPVFAPLDGVVLSVHDGEFDQHTVADPNAESNRVVLSHGTGYRTEYLHLKRNSITVAEGDPVTAGQQIGLIGSSGTSAAPHLHWDVWVDGVPVEPMAGPCRSGASLFERQPEISNDAAAIGLSFSDVPFSGYPSPPFDTAPRQATFLAGTQSLNLKVEVANIRAGSDYTLIITPPSGQPLTPVTGELTAYTAYLASASWDLDVLLNQAGTWMATLLVNDHRVFENVPFTVVNSPSQIVNRAPNTPQIEIEPVGIRLGEVPVCRVMNGVLPDPDSDVVSYHYQWRVNDTVVRDVITAARADALARDQLLAHSTLTCTVTVSDGQTAAPAVQAVADIGGAVRRRAARR